MALVAKRAPRNRSSSTTQSPTARTAAKSPVASSSAALKKVLWSPNSSGKERKWRRASLQHVVEHRVVSGTGLDHRAHRRHFVCVVDATECPWPCQLRHQAEGHAHELVSHHDAAAPAAIGPEHRFERLVLRLGSAQIVLVFPATLVAVRLQAEPLPEAKLEGVHHAQVGLVRVDEDDLVTGAGKRAAAVDDAHTVATLNVTQTLS